MLAANVNLPGLKPRAFAAVFILKPPESLDDSSGESFILLRQDYVGQVPRLSGLGLSGTAVTVILYFILSF